jgi:hypothetical protein
MAGQDTIFDVDDRGILLRRAPLDRSWKIVIPAVLRHRLLHLDHFPKVAGHPGMTRDV